LAQRERADVVRFVRPSYAPGLELVHYPHLTRGWQGIPEAYTWFTMIPRLQGDVDVISRGARSACEPGSLTIGEPGEPYALRPRAGMDGEFQVVRIDNSLHDAHLQELGVRRGESPFPVRPQRNPALVRAFSRLFGALDAGDGLETEERLYAFLVTIVRRSSAHGGNLDRARNSRGVRRARDLLHARFDASLTLDELAAAAGTEKFALLRAFSRELGLTPHAYQVQLRIARACRLIAQGQPLAETALSVGYSEQSALARQFRRVVGVTPGAYGRAVR
jgi:AraC-like DNA-binding protein